jgi:hypothetical protein
LCVVAQTFGKLGRMPLAYPVVTHTH